MYSHLRKKKIEVKEWDGLVFRDCTVFEIHEEIGLTVTGVIADGSIIEGPDLQIGQKIKIYCLDLEGHPEQQATFPKAVKQIKNGVLDITKLISTEELARAKVNDRSVHPSCAFE